MKSTGHFQIRPQARADILEFAGYFAQAAGMSEEGFIDTVFGTIGDLAGMPGMGSLKPFRGRRLQGIRSWSVRGLRKILILYRPTDDGIEVITVSHGARNLKAILTRRLKNSP